MASSRRNDDGSAPQAVSSTSVQRMDAFDKLPKPVRQELSAALLDYTPIDFYYHYYRGMKPLELLEVIWKANIRDHLTKAKAGDVPAIPQDQLKGYKFNLDPIRECRSPRTSRLGRLRQLSPRAGRT
jgi:hypothetical protein